MWYNTGVVNRKYVGRGDVISIPRPDTRKDKFLMQLHSTRLPSFPENLNDYAPWVAKHGLIAPYGECQCGCGEKTRICNHARPYKGQVFGEPIRFVKGHGKRNVLLIAFWKNVKQGSDDECWEWKGSVVGKGYGVLRCVNETKLAHRISYELHHGPIPDGLDCLHKCDNPPCVNPNHLFLGTNDDNIQDKVTKGRQPKGSTHANARWSEDDIRAMRDLYASGVSQREIAAIYHTHQGTVGHIVRRKAWKHIE